MRDEETALALQALLKDPEAAQTALWILREELQTARGSERQALMDTISMLESKGARHR